MRVPSEREMLQQVPIAHLERQHTIGPGTVEAISRTLGVVNAWDQGEVVVAAGSAGGG